MREDNVNKFGSPNCLEQMLKSGRRVGGKPLALLIWAI